MDSPALALFNPELPVIVSTDTSDYGLGAILSQVHPDHSECTVAFASQTLTPDERRYSTVEKEALACVWAFEKWRTYLWGRRFTLSTDHQALTTLLSTRRSWTCQDARCPVLAFCASRMTCYIVLAHQIILLDACHGYPFLSLLLPTPMMLVALLSTSLTAISPSEFKTAAASCPVLTSVCTQIEKGWPVSVKAVHCDLQPYYHVRNELSVKDSCV